MARLGGEGEEGEGEEEGEEEGEGEGEGTHCGQGSTHDLQVSVSFPSQTEGKGTTWSLLTHPTITTKPHLPARGSGCYQWVWSVPEQMTVM